ncbi:MAG: hypothetical protein OJK14_02900 [Achromobacter sp.]|uniref:hypothetical protein n=1 Tax=Achromobacter sp. TaxID=134375 RepID=UPI00258DBC21|nr:hypothetical protein [Achromobacter sp.]MCW0206017.1 hypothetical protein [Achromobacter sp.]
MDKPRSPLFREISDMESPLTSAEAAAVTLSMLVDELGDDNEGVAIVYLSGMIRTHLDDLRKHFGQVYGLALRATSPPPDPHATRPTVGRTSLPLEPSP